MRNLPGFMLINFCVYLALFFLISCLTALLAQQSYTLYKARLASNARIEDVYVAQDFFVYDVRSAPNVRRAWTRLENNVIEWKTDDVTVRWEIRISGLAANNYKIRKGSTYSKKHSNPRL